MINYRQIEGYYCDCGNIATFEVAEPLEEGIEEGIVEDIFEGSDFLCERCFEDLLSFNEGREHFGGSKGL